MSLMGSGPPQGPGKPQARSPPQQPATPTLSLLLYRPSARQPEEACCQGGTQSPRAGQDTAAWHPIQWGGDSPEQSATAAKASATLWATWSQ